MLLRILVVFSLFFATVNARAGTADDKDDDAGGSAEARARFADGNQRYARGDYQGAADSFKAAIAADPKLPGPYRNLGLCYRALGNCNDALPMYEKYLQLKPESRFTERVRREIDLCRAKLGMAPIGPPPGTPTVPVGPAQPQSLLHVAANLMGGEATDEASVRVDGLVRGSTPLTIPVTPGVHRVHLERPGWEAVDTVIDVKPGERKEVELTMNKLPEAPRPAVTSMEGAPGERKPLRKYAWAMIGVAAAAGIVGAGMGIAESGEYAEVAASDRTATPRRTVEQHRDKAANYAIGAWVGLGVGGAALATAVILFALDSQRGETAEKQKYVLSPTINEGGAGLAAAGRW